jgi:uncharacterized protein (DUF1330 family)
MGSVEPTPEKLQQLTALEDGPIVMINLLRYRAQAEYPEGFEATPCSGREAYQRYGAVAARLVGAVGGRPLWIGNVKAAVIAPAGEEWDDAVLVEYPSRKAFLEMVSQPEYQAVAPHRTAALEDSRLIATQTVADRFTSG